jgi:hypothetical protein
MPHSMEQQFVTIDFIPGFQQVVGSNSVLPSAGPSETEPPHP